MSPATTAWLTEVEVLLSCVFMREASDPAICRAPEASPVCTAACAVALALLMRVAAELVVLSCSRSTVTFTVLLKSPLDTPAASTTLIDTITSSAKSEIPAGRYRVVLVRVVGAPRGVSCAFRCPTTT